MNISVIGAGLGGLSAACLLAQKGHSVTVFEKNDRAGGKINEIRSAGFRFDTGPSLLTMPHILEKLFSTCGASMQDYLQLVPVEPLCRYFYPDGTVFNSYQEPQKAIAEVNHIAPEDTANYRHFLQYAAALYERTHHSFLENPLYNLSDFSSLKMTDIFKIDALQTVAGRIDSVFDSPYMQQFFKRFTTYNGSSPFLAPATLNVIPHVELSMGGFYIKGGMYKLVEALMKLARKKGVRFHFGTDVTKIELKNGHTTGIRTSKGTFKSNAIFSNSDAYETYTHLLSSQERFFLTKKKIQQAEPSCSGLVLLLGIDRKYEQLSHHSIFFSRDYKKEFDDIFDRKVMPDDPTIYVADTSFQNPEHAIAGGSNLFVLVNAPYLSGCWKWSDQKQNYSNFIIDTLEKRGLKKLRDAIIYQHEITPVDFYEKYRSNKGSIYGTSSNSKMAAFLRPKNKARNVGGLYLVGGSTHPGGGIPLVILSAFNAVELIQRYE